MEKNYNLNEKEKEEELLIPLTEEDIYNNYMKNRRSYLVKKKGSGGNIVGDIFILKILSATKVCFLVQEESMNSRYIYKNEIFKEYQFIESLTF